MLLLPVASYVEAAHHTPAGDHRPVDTLTTQQWKPLTSRPAAHVFGSADVTDNSVVSSRSRSPLDLIPWAPAPTASAKTRIEAVQEQRPLSFVENLGQHDQHALFYARRGPTTLWITRDTILFDVSKQSDMASDNAAAQAHSLAPVTTARRKAERLVFSEQLVGINPDAQIQAGVELPGRFNYLVGGDHSRWRAGARTYRLLTYRNAWNGIDMRLYGMQNDLEQEFVVRPGSDPSQIKIALTGVDGVQVGQDGSLTIATAFGELRQEKPFAYQTVDGKRVPVEARFEIVAANSYTFRVGPHDPSRPLVIDPVLLYSTYLGGVHDDQGMSIALDAEGNAYIAGFSASENFPVSANAFQLDRKHIGLYVYNAFITKLSPNGTVLYSTFIGGNGTAGGTCGAGFAGDCAQGIAVDAEGNAYLAGLTSSSDYPTTTDAFQPTYGGGLTDAFVTELSSDGSALVYSTFLGGSGAENAQALTLDSQGAVYVVGNAGSGGFPATPGAFQTQNKGSDNGFVAKLDTTQNGAKSLIYSTYLGGHGNMTYGGLFAIAVDSNGRAVVGGQTQASDFPTTTNALIKTVTTNSSCSPNDPPHSFGTISKLSPDGSRLLYSTYFGGTHIHQEGFRGCDQGVQALTLDSQGNIYISGFTNTDDFPGVSTNSAINSFGCCTFQAFAAKLKSDGSALDYATYMGGRNDQSFMGRQMTVDSNGNALTVGLTSGTQLPTTNNAINKTSGGGTDGFVCQLNASGSGFTYCSYLGGNNSDAVLGVANDAFGNIYVSGATNSTTFPVSNNAFQSAYAGGDRNDAFVAAMGTGTIGSILPSSGGNAGSVTLGIRGTGFQQGASVTLLGPQTIHSSLTSIGQNGSTAVATFELTGAPVGAYDVTITNPDNTEFTRPKGFKVTNGGSSRISIGLVGRSKIRVNTPTPFFVNVSNAGEEDAYLVLAWLFFPPDVTVIRNFDPIVPPQPAGTTFGAVPDSFQVDTATSVIPLLIPLLPAKATFAFPFLVSSPNLTQFDLEAFVNAPFSTSITNVLGGVGPSSVQEVSLGGPEGSGGSCSVDDWLNVLRDCLNGLLGSPQSCTNVTLQGGFVNDYFSLPSQYLGWMLGGAQGPAPQPAMLGNQAVKNLLDAMAKCLQDFSLNSFLNAQKLAECLGKKALKNIFPPKKPPTCKSSGPSAALLEELTDFEEEPTIQNLLPLEAGPTCDDPTTPNDCSSPQPVGAIDPNDKTGPGGAGKGHWVVAGNPLTYTVQYENKPSATAPAQEVVITDQLDPAKMDLSTFRLGPMGFGKTLVTPPPGQKNFSTTLDLRPGQDLLVQVQGSIDLNTAVAKWTFRSLDPATGLPPADPEAGFLPPNTHPPDGEGAVVFSINPKRGVQNGTKVTNMASIVFDTNAPIDTPTWKNTLAARTSRTLTIPTRVQFPQTAVNASSAPKKVVIENPQGGSQNQGILLSNVSISSPFAAVDPTACSNVLLLPGKKCVIKVVFQPTAAGQVSGILRIFDNATGSPQKVKLTGTGQ